VLAWSVLLVLLLLLFHVALLSIASITPFHSANYRRMYRSKLFWVAEQQAVAG
jgi:hypothetical protein